MTTERIKFYKEIGFSDRSEGKYKKLTNWRKDAKQLKEDELLSALRLGFMFSVLQKIYTEDVYRKEVASLGYSLARAIRYRSMYRNLSRFVSLEDIKDFAAPKLLLCYKKIRSKQDAKEWLGFSKVYSDAEFAAIAVGREMQVKGVYVTPRIQITTEEWDENRCDKVLQFYGMYFDDRGIRRNVGEAMLELIKLGANEMAKKKKAA